MPKPIDRSQRAVRRDSYEAMLDINRPAQEGQDAYAIAKFTYKIEGGHLHVTEPEPLLNDFLDPDLDPRLTADTDFWPYKYATDLVVIGSAFAPRGVPVPSIQVGVDVGSVSKRIAVFGRREVAWVGERPRIGSPEPFTEIPITWENAYGGTDWRIPFQHEDFEDDEMLGAMVAAHDHPGMYPRNPFGRGYLVESGEVPEMLMPNLEDPQDLLTPDRLLVGDPALWWRQPLPWCFDWVSPATFPRYVWVDESVDAWFPGPEDEELPEVARGYLMPFHSLYMEEDHDPDDGPATTFYQGASHGLVLETLQGGEPVHLYNMHPELPVISFALHQARPTFRFFLEGRAVDVEPRLHSVICKPADETVSMVYAADVELHRSYIPGVHKSIPIAVSIAGDAPIEYEAPPTLKGRLETARSQEKNGGMDSQNKSGP